MSAFLGVVCMPVCVCARVCAHVCVASLPPAADSFSQEINFMKRFDSQLICKDGKVRLKIAVNSQ